MNQNIIRFDPSIRPGTIIAGRTKESVTEPQPMKKNLIMVKYYSKGLEVINTN